MFDYLFIYGLLCICKMMKFFVLFFFSHFHFLVYKLMSLILIQMRKILCWNRYDLSNAISIIDFFFIGYEIIYF